MQRASQSPRDSSTEVSSFYPDELAAFWGQPRTTGGRTQDLQDLRQDGKRAARFALVEISDHVAFISTSPQQSHA